MRSKPRAGRFSAFSGDFPALFQEFCRFRQKPEKPKPLIARAFARANWVPSSKAALARPCRPENRNAIHQRPRPRGASTSPDEIRSAMASRSLAHCSTDALNSMRQKAGRVEPTKSGRIHRLSRSLHPRCAIIRQVCLTPESGQPCRDASRSALCHKRSLVRIAQGPALGLK